MEVSASSPDQLPVPPASKPDPRLQPTPDYGTLGPGSDIGLNANGPQANSLSKRGLATGQLIAVFVGMIAALFVGTARRGSLWPTHPTSSSERKPVTAVQSARVDDLQPQKQAETLLEMAVRHSDGAVEQISSQVDQWQGEVRWTPQIASLTTAALNSDDMRVRQSGVEVELAAYGLGKNSASFDYVLQTLASRDHSQKVWALWALGLLANRGVQSEVAVDTLITHLKNDDVDSRRWAAEGLALAATDSSIDALLKAMHDDPSPVVRERAACGLAESGLFTKEQRLAAVPQLLGYTDDSSLDAQTHAWAFQALGDITHQRLPNDAAAWRSWYQKQTAGE